MPTAHIALGWVRDGLYDDGFGEDSAAAFLEHLELGTKLDRYTRTWIMGRAAYQGKDVWGRIGFVSNGEGAEIWDEVKKDFAEVASPTGASAPFVVLAANGRLSFQFRPGLMDRSAYCSALEALANLRYAEGAKAPRWRVWADLGKTDWDSWVQGTSGVRRLRFRLELPNPNWIGREELQGIIEGTRSTMLETVLTTDDPAGLNLDDSFVVQSIEHTVRKGYGSLTAEATLGSGDTKRKFESAKKEASAEVKVALDTGQRDAGPETLQTVARGSSGDMPDVPKRRRFSKRAQVANTADG